MRAAVAAQSARRLAHGQRPVQAAAGRRRRRPGQADDLLAGALAEVAGPRPARGAQAEQAAEQAAAAAQQARARHRSAQAAADKAEAELSSARAALRTARDPLVELGAPPVDDAGLAAGWAALAGWAGEQAQARAAALDQAREAAAAAAGQRKRLTAEFGDAERALARLRAAAKTASDDDQRARARLSQVTARIAELGELLADAPSDEQITERLALLDRLEAAAAAAEDGRCVRRAPSGRRARRPSRRWSETERSARGQLSAARDRVVALGAPALDGHGLLDGWTDLVTWASGEVKVREQEAEAAAREADAARAGIARADQPAERRPGRRRDRPRSRSGRRLGRRRGDRRARGGQGGHAGASRNAAPRPPSLVGKQRTAQEEQQVAHLLGNLLQARQFPQWLVSEALDDLVAAASQTLAALSSGQFDLTHDKGDLFVIDHADADARRSVRTLSGGETFQASLALALALSSQISALAAAGAARLDSIFLDEGFGTLDAGDPGGGGHHAGGPRPGRPDGRRGHPRDGTRRAGPGPVPGRAERPDLDRRPRGTAARTGDGGASHDTELSDARTPGAPATAAAAAQAARGMRFSVDGWDPSYGASLELEGQLEESTARIDAGVEVPADRWRPIDPDADGPAPRRAAVRRRRAPRRGAASGSTATRSAPATR